MKLKNRTLKSFLRIFLVGVFLFLNQLIFAKQIPFGASQIESLKEIFFDAEKLSLQKIENFKKKLDQKKEEIINILKNYHLLYKDKSQQKVQKIIDEEKILVIYNMIYEKLDLLINLSSLNEQIEMSQKILAIYEASFVEGVRLANLRRVTYIRESVRPWEIPLSNENQFEAENLVKENGEYYNQIELQNLKKEGEDLSLLNPSSQNSFWTSLSIESINLDKNFYHFQKIYEGVQIYFPEGEVFYKKIRKTQSKPKIEVTKVINGKKLKFKLKIGSEMHSGPTSEALFAAIGYSTDPEKYVRNIKVNLGNKVTIDEFKSDWNSYYNSYDVNLYIKEEGIDEKGNSYIIFKEGVYEYKSKKLFRAGPWAWGKNGVMDDRAARAILIFNMWVSNLDLKESENNKLVLKENKNGGHDFYYLQHDMGFAFGKRFREKPGAYPWELVQKKGPHSIKMNYHNFQKNSGFKEVTYFDGKWMTRLIARLSRKQISDAVKLGGWPEGIEQLLIEKLIARRNQLVEAFDLEEEFSLLEFDRYLTTDDGTVVNGELKKFEFDGFSQNFGNEFSEMIRPFLHGIRNVFVDNLATFSQKATNYSIDPAEFGFNDGIISKIIIGVDREIEKNPAPTSSWDQYLVKDRVRLGFRLGYGYVLTGDMAYVRDYTLVYPVETRDKGRFAQNFIVDFFLPLKIQTKKLPPHSVLILENYLEGRGQLRLLDEFAIPISSDISYSKIKISRSFLSRKEDDKIIYFEDSSIYSKLAHALSVRLALMKLPFLKQRREKGKLQRDYYEISLNEQDDLENIVENFMHNFESSWFKKNSRKRVIEDQFLSTFFRFQLFKFLRLRSGQRVDHFQDHFLSNDEEVNYTFRGHQIESQKSFDWSFMGTGEFHRGRTRIISELDDNEEFINPHLEIKLEVEDLNTKTKEMNAYLKLANGTMKKQNQIKFTPENYTSNNLWGNVNVDIDLIINTDGLNNILNFSNEDLMWKYLSSLNQIPAEKLKKASRPLKGLNEDGDVRTLARKAIKFFKNLEKISRKETWPEKYKKLAQSIKKCFYRNEETYNFELISFIRNYALSL